jgi:hypothetical protein
VEGDDHGEAYTAIVWSGLLSRERYKPAGAETVENVEGNMLRTVMRGATALPWSKTPLRPKGTRRNLGDRVSRTQARRVCGAVWKMKDRPFEVGFREQASNHPKRHRSKAGVVSVGGKGR